MKIKIARTLATLGALAFASSVAYAGPAPASLTYKVDASFDTSQTKWTSGSTKYIQNGREYISWGDPSYLQINDDETRVRSVIFSSSANGVYKYQSTTVASLIHHNDPISAADAHLRSTDMLLSIDILGTTLTQKFDIYFSETLNDPGFGLSCAAGTGAKPCGDIFVVDWAGRNNSSNFSYSFDPILSGGYEYVVTLDDNNLFKALSSQACAAAGAAAGCVGFVTPEGGTTSWNFNVSVTATAITAVPEPETYAMLLAGLGIVGMVARRRRIAPHA
ncbi:MAG: THxN family PEP-CTERM protein [Azoarcus sp.]|jgi:hypothetical protein|nr:THxN family PEP-CTERM protein [Azoarcus sp.]